MSAQFFGLAPQGSNIIAIKDAIRLRGYLLNDFEGIAGAPSAVHIASIEVLSGEFPGNIDQMTLNSNGWEIYREGVDEIPSSNESREYDRLIEALAILRTVLREHGGGQWLSAEHDVIYSSIDPEHFSEEQLQRLEELGWSVDPDDGNFYHFV